MKKLLAILFALVMVAPAFGLVRNQSGQKIVVLAWDSATGRPKTGLTGTNIVVSLSKDSGTITAIADTTLTELAQGQYEFDLTQAETNADVINVTASSATSGVDVYGLPATINTTVAKPASQTVPKFSDSGAIVSFGAGSSNDNSVSVTFDSTGSDDIEFFVTHATAGFNSITVTDSNGGVITAVDDDTNGSIRGRWYRIIKPVTSSSHTISVVCNGGGLPSIVGVCLRGSRLEDLSAATPTQLITGTGTSFQAGSVTPSVDNAVVISVAHAYAGTMTPDGTFTNVTSVSQTANHIGSCIATKTQTTATASNPTTTTGSTGDHIARTLAIKPALQTYGTTIDSFPDGEVFQRQPRIANEWWHKRVAMSGAYVDEQPAYIEVQGYAYGTSTVVLPWQRLEGTTISGGTWSGVLDVPQRNGWYSFAARGVAADGRILGTSATQACGAGVGVIVGLGGQSNGFKLFQVFDAPTATNTLTRQYYSGSWIPVDGDGAIELANRLQAGLECPVALLNNPISGAGLQYNAGNGDWTSLTGGQPLPLFLTALSNVGGDIEFFVFIGTEADVLDPSITGTAIKTGFDTLQSRILAANTMGRTTANLKFGVSVLGPLDDENDADVSTVRQATIEWPEEADGAFTANNPIDATLVDFAHRNGPSYVRDGKRIAQSILHQLGIETTGAKGPKVFNAWRSGNKIYVALTGLQGSHAEELNGAIDGDSLTGFGVAADSVWGAYTIASTALSGNVVELTLNATPASDEFIQVRFAYGQLRESGGEQPEIANMVYGSRHPQGDSRGLPLLPCAAITAPVRTAFESGQVISRATLPQSTGFVGWTLKDLDGTVLLPSTSENMSIVSESIDSVVYQTFFDKPSGFSNGSVVWDNGTDVVADQVPNLYNLDAPVSEAGGTGTPADISTENIHTSLVFTLVHKSSGLVSEDTKTITKGSPNTYAIDFRNDAGAGKKIYTIGDLDITSGSGSGLTFGTPERDGGTQVRVRITGVMAGNYTVKVPVVYVGGATAYGYITVKVVE